MKLKQGNLTMERFTKYSIISLSIALVSGCQSPQNSISISPAQYSSYNCRQLSKEMFRISQKIESATEKNNTNQILGTALAAYAISQNYAFSSGDNDEETQLLKAQYDALSQASIQKDCE